MSTPEILYMVVPCYNEEEVLHETAKRLKEKYQSLIGRDLISEKSRVVFVNDGSKDKTWQIIQELHAADPAFFSGVNLAHNAGHQNAVSTACAARGIPIPFSRNSRLRASISS